VVSLTRVDALMEVNQLDHKAFAFKSKYIWRQAKRSTANLKKKFLI
jgi:hypothetical protein